MYHPCNPCNSFWIQFQLQITSYLTLFHFFWLKFTCFSSKYSTMFQYIFFLLLWASYVASCPDNCQCTEYTAECVIVDCESELETMFDSLTVNGFLCKFHREILENLQDLTDIILMNDKCGRIPNCRFIILKLIFISDYFKHTIFYII